MWTKKFKSKAEKHRGSPCSNVVHEAFGWTLRGRLSYVTYVVQGLPSTWATTRRHARRGQAHLGHCLHVGGVAESCGFLPSKGGSQCRKHCRLVVPAYESLQDMFPAWTEMWLHRNEVG